MTELEITKLAAEAMGLDVRVGPLQGTVMRCWIKIGNVEHEYWPLYNDVQAMALVKKFPVSIKEAHVKSRIEDGPFSPPEIPWYYISIDTGICYPDAPNGVWKTEGHDLNRAICECVAKMQLAKAKP